MAGLLVCPAFPRVVSGRCRVRRVDGWSCGNGWSGGGCEYVAPERGPLLGPGPVGGQVQDAAALWSGEAGGHAGDLAGPRRAAGDGVAGAAQGAGGAQQVVGDGRADGPGAVGGKPAGGQG